MFLNLGRGLGLSLILLVSCVILCVWFNVFEFFFFIIFWRVRVVYEGDIVMKLLMVVCLVRDVFIKVKVLGGILVGLLSRVVYG